MIRRRTFLAAAAAALVPAKLPAQFVPGQFAKQLTIGVNVPLTGPLGDYGRMILRGAQAAVDYNLRFSPIAATTTYAIRPFDDQNSTAVASSNVSFAQADPSTIAMIGNLSANVTLDTLPRYANANFAVVVPTVTADAVTARGFRNVFRLATKDSTEGQLFARAALAGRKGVSALAVTIDGEYGFDAARGFVAQAKANHIDADVLTFSRDADPGAAAATLLQRRPNYIFLAGKVASLGPLAVALRKAAYSGDFGASDGFYTQSTIDEYGSALADALVASPLPPLARIPSMLPVVTDFERQVGTVTAFVAYGYAAAQLIILAAQRIAAPSRFEVLGTLQRGGTPYNVLVGSYSFTVAGDATIPNTYLYRITKDGFRFEKPAFLNGFVI